MWQLATMLARQKNHSFHKADTCLKHKDARDTINGIPENDFFCCNFGYVSDPAEAVAQLPGSASSEDAQAKRLCCAKERVA